MRKKVKNEMTNDLRRVYNLRELLKGGVPGKYVKRWRHTNLVLLSPDLRKAFREGSERHSAPGDSVEGHLERQEARYTHHNVWLVA